MKKGFTLIELLAVITLIGVLSVIGTISVTKLINSSKEKTYQEQIKNIETSAKTWATNNTALLALTSDFKTYVSVEELKQAGLLENKDIIDPRNDKPMTGCVQITYSTETKKYKYNYSNNCGNKADYPTIDIVYNENDKNYIEVTQDTLDKKDEIINNININAFDKNGNVVNVEGPTITKNGEEVDNVIPNKVGDEYVFTYIASQNNLKTTKTLKLKVVDTTSPEIYLNSVNVTGRIVNNTIPVNTSFSEPTLTVKDNSGETIKAIRSGKLNTQNIGEYKLVYTATDSSKNKSTYIVNVAVRPPNKLTFSLEPSAINGNNGWHKSNPTVSITDIKFGITDEDQASNNTTCKYSINSGSEVNLGTTRSFEVNTEGSSINVKVDCSYTDENNDTYNDSQTVILKIDKTNPTCSTSGGNSSWTNKNVTITGKCSDSLSGCAGNNPSYTVTTAGTKTNIGPGSNGGVAIVYDKAGNQATCPANQSVKIDKVAPKCTVTKSHSGWTKENVTVTGTCSDSGGSGCTSYSPSETYSTTTNEQKYPALLQSNAYVKDNAGNKADCGTTLVQIDKTDPYSPFIGKATLNGNTINDFSCTCMPSAITGSMYKLCSTVLGNSCVINTNSRNIRFEIWGGDIGSGVSHWGYTIKHLGGGANESYIRKEIGEPLFTNWFSSTVYIKTYDHVGNESPMMTLRINS